MRLKKASSLEETVVAVEPSRSALIEVEEACEIVSSLKSEANDKKGGGSRPGKLQQLNQTSSFLKADTVGLICSGGDEAVVFKPPSCETVPRHNDSCEQVKRTSHRAWR